MIFLESTLGNIGELCKFVSALATEGSHNGIAAVLKTAGRDPVGVRVPRPPLRPKKIHHILSIT